MNGDAYNVAGVIVPKVLVDRVKKCIEEGLPHGEAFRVIPYTEPYLEYNLKPTPYRTILFRYKKAV